MQIQPHLPLHAGQTVVDIRVSDLIDTRRIEGGGTIAACILYWFVWLVELSRQKVIRAA